ncbi:N-acetylmuramic acid 6-phosphate etherase [Kumtagia ephedrae]|uniref:N-acetylmuramic acid 6-phosphate etherase n=1 Tax=Kumtagia ephedrae TaxID=2116701 RepID=A0A2P7S8C4_9HYPH|nr:N-acetylmuramic acid 6-phosphate etherase [Mesorhizobium ephedrae]PSJ58739.1 N-acetylmuramic acid 6-phosphate etherase [Mesorhizobium ephedrae]
MAHAGTEAVNAKAKGLDEQPPASILRLLADAQVEAANSVHAAVDAIALAAEIAAGRLAVGGRLFYAAAGSSGLMALADALELPGTYGIPSERVVVLIAGGRQAFVDLPGAPEDDAAEAAREVAENGLDAGDCLIALSASGTTPYAVAALDEAHRRGAATIGIANNAGTPLATRGDVGIVLATPPEMIAGSTRMGAGTAQKIALNMFSTLVAIHLGHVHDGYMVNLRPDNMKLRDRAARIVAAIAGCGRDEAQRLLEKTGGAVKPAILLAAGADDLGTATRLLAEAGQKLRPALAGLEEGSTRSHHNRT